ncbi:MAG: DUF2812 domain-containing protein [Lachnospiraceae bacterium]|nr:DUF2812 domain-containing protein [Lachnospiraceae bacterium]
MKKFKIFMSLAKERDWLEEMARQGFLLTNITMGVFYTFKECEPCEKVYEVERFAISSNPTIAELTARTNAIDVATQFGWEMVTHDENMNYYFVKDKASDETDEFYDDEESRRERAERYRKSYCIEQPLGLLLGELVISFLYLVLYFLLDNSTGLLIVYLLLTIFELLCIYQTMRMGQLAYRELSMSREEWALYKKFSEKKSFNKVQQLRSYLQEKSEFGLSLKGYEDNQYLFEEDSKRYNYFVDTKACLKKRLKEEGNTFTDESKDWANISLNWYESSIANTAQYGLKPVAVINKRILIYKRPYSDAPLPWENGNENINFSLPTLAGLIIMIIAFSFGFLIGVLAAILL